MERWIMMGKLTGHIFILAVVLGIQTSCRETDQGVDQAEPADTSEVSQPPFDINDLKDTYEEIAPLANNQHWGLYNTHDPSIIKSGEYFYSYSTDAADGTAVPAGIGNTDKVIVELIKKTPSYLQD